MQSTATKTNVELQRRVTIPAGFFVTTESGLGSTVGTWRPPTLTDLLACLGGRTGARLPAATPRRAA